MKFDLNIRKDRTRDVYVGRLTFGDTVITSTSWPYDERSVFRLDTKEDIELEKKRITRSQKEKFDETVTHLLHMLGEHIKENSKTVYYNENIGQEIETYEFKKER